MYYALFLLSLVIYILIVRKDVVTNKALLLIFAPLLAFVTVKGSIGTDFDNYTVLINNIMSGEYVAYKPEPFFIFVVKLFSLFTTNPNYIVNLVSLLVVGLFFIGLSQTSEKQRPFLLSILFPYFIFDFSTNVLRFGVGAGLYLLAMALYDRNKAKPALVVLALSLSAHLSMLILLVYFTVFYFKKQYLKIHAALFVVFSAYYMSRFLNRYNVYSPRPEIEMNLAFAGVSVVVLFFLLVLFFYKTHLRKLAILMLVGSIALSSVGSISIALVRLNHLILFGAILLFAMKDRDLEKRSKMFLIGLFSVCCLLKINNIYFQKTDQKSAYLPWEFVWEYKPVSAQ